MRATALIPIKMARADSEQSASPASAVVDHDGDYDHGDGEYRHADQDSPDAPRAVVDDGAKVTGVIWKGRGGASTSPELFDLHVPIAYLAEAVRRFRNR